MAANSREKLLVILAAASIGLLVGDRYILTPLIKAWKARSERIVTLTRDLSTSETKLGRRRDLQETWTHMQSNSLPTDVTVAQNKLSRAVEQWKQTSGIDVTSHKPQWRRNPDDYSVLEYQVDAVGNMQSVARFIYEMERDPLALRVENIKITTRDNSGQKLALTVRFNGLQFIPTAK